MDPRPAPGPITTTTLLGDWYADLLANGSRRLVLCTSETSLLTVILPAEQLNTGLRVALGQAVGELLSRIGADAAAVAAEMAEMAEMGVAPTERTSVVESMTEFVQILDASSHFSSPASLVEVGLFLSKTPCGLLNYDRPEHVARCLVQGRLHV